MVFLASLIGPIELIAASKKRQSRSVADAINHLLQVQAGEADQKDLLPCVIETFGAKFIANSRLTPRRISTHRWV